MNDTARLHVVRDRAYYGRWRKLRIQLDGGELGVVGHGETRVFEIAAGQHALYVQMDWVRSESVEFRCEPGSDVVAFCDAPECTRTLWRLLRAGTRKLMTEPFTVRVAVRGSTDHPSDSPH